DGQVRDAVAVEVGHRHRLGTGPRGEIILQRCEQEGVRQAVDRPVTDDLAAPVDGSRNLEHPAGPRRDQAIEVVHPGPVVEEGVLDAAAGGDFRKADHLTGAVDAESLAGGSAESTEVLHGPAVVAEGMVGRIAGRSRVAYHLAGVVDAPGYA